MTFGRTALLALAAAGLAACGGSNDSETRERDMEDYAERHGVDADVEVDEQGEVESVAIKSPTGGQYGKDLKLPDGFPDDVPVSPDWSIVAATPMPQGGYSLQAMSAETMEAALETVRARMTAQGWAETAMESASPQMRRLSFEKDARMTSINLIDAGDGVSVQLLTMDQPG